jgi:membrane-bound inhibitor of C-type lysozyme
MNSSRKSMWALITVFILAVIALLLLLAAGGTSSLPSTQTGAANPPQTIEATYSCDAGRTIEATYQNATTATTTGNAVMLVLSDTRQMTLPQTISADGARYATADESFVFWSKGNGAFVQENGTTTYDNCLTQNSY